MNNYASKIGLGTAQWGMSYGVSNKSGQTSPKEIRRILKTAHTTGISLLDTASLYGNAEQVLGKSDLSAYKVITKTKRFNQFDGLEVNADQLVETFNLSLQNLGLDSIYGLLFHDANDLLLPNGLTLLDALEKLKSQGFVSKIGVSVYNSNQIKMVLDYFKPDIIQLPVNVLDQRLLRDKTIENLSSLGIEVHARSVFLQGLLLMNFNEIPKYFEPWMPVLLEWQKKCSEKIISPLHAALDFVCRLEEISYVVVGVQNLSQLKEILEVKSVSDGFDYEQFASSDQGLLNPSVWRLS